MTQHTLTPADISSIIAMAWDDHIPFSAIAQQYGLSEVDVIRLMRQEMKASSYRMWRKRVTGRRAKHANHQQPPTNTRTKRLDIQIEGS